MGNNILLHLISWSCPVKRDFLKFLFCYPQSQYSQKYRNKKTSNKPLIKEVTTLAHQDKPLYSNLKNKGVDRWIALFRNRIFSYFMVFITIFILF